VLDFRSLEDFGSLYLPTKIESLAAKRGGAKILSEEIEQKEELPREGIPVPLYFDRYVASELRALGQQIVALKDSMDERFDQVDNRFTQVDNRFTQADRRIDELKESMEGRFVQVDRRIDELKEFDKIDKQFDKYDANTKWVIGLFFPIIAGILAIIVKTFF
jgi:flagellar capping protein FliD